MRNTTNTPAIPADRIASAITHLESSLRDSEAQRDRNFDLADSFYAGRVSAFDHAIKVIREVLQ